MTVKGRVVVVGAGMGGLAASIALAARGIQVTTLDAAEGPGGKMREVEAGGRRIDAGPTVLTMPWVFEQIFEDAGARLSRQVTLNRTLRLARHAWGDGSQLDLYSDVDQTAEAIADFAGAREADGYRRFCKRAECIYRTLRDTFISGSRPGPVELATRVGLSRLPDLMGISPFTTLSRALEDHFSDPRLRQLFGRYATYCGSSPFLAPATSCWSLTSSVRAFGLSKAAWRASPRRWRNWRERVAHNFDFNNALRGLWSRTAARSASRRTRASGFRRTPSSGTGTPPPSAMEAGDPRLRGPSPQPRRPNDPFRPSPGR